MSRNAFVLASSVAFVVIIGFIAAMSIERQGSSPLTDDLSRRLSELEQKLAVTAEHRAAPAVVSAPARRATEPAREPDNDDEREETENDQTDFEDAADGERLAQRFDDIERRVEALERDPITRGYAFIDSENPDLRRQGISSLASLARRDPEARQTIRGMTSDPDSSVRATAIDALSDIEDKESLPYFLAALEDEDPRVRREAIDGMDDIDAVEHAAAVARLVDDPDDSVRRDAVDVIGKLKFAGGMDYLLQALNDKNDDVRREAIASLGEIGAKDSAPILRKLFDEGQGRERWSIANSLRALGDTQPWEQEVARLSREALEDQDPRKRRDALRTLTNYARNDAQEIFRRATEDPNESVRQAAQQALRYGRLRR